MTDKRKAPRIEIRFPVICCHENDNRARPDKSKRAMLNNLGKNGLCLKTRAPLEQGAVRISGTDDFSRLTITGEVMYSHKHPSAVPGAPEEYETGVRFTDTPDNTLKFITTVVKTAGKGPKNIPKEKTGTGRPDREETLATTFSPDIAHDLENKGRTLDTSQPPPGSHPHDDTESEISIKKYKIPFVKGKSDQPPPAPLEEAPHLTAGDDTDIPSRVLNPSGRSRFSTEHTGLVISAFILLSTVIVIAPTPFRNHIRFLKEADIQLPFRTQSKQTAPRQPHANELILTENSATCDFIQNTNSGPVLVIEGTIPPHPRFTGGNPKITGRLLDKAGTVLKKVESYAGTTLSEAQLSTCRPREMENMLREQTDLKGQHDKKPYMIVFTNLPENLDGLHAEVVISPLP